MVMAEFIDFARLFNFRDAGGVSTADGHEVATQKLYRSDNLGSLTDDDVSKYMELGIRTVVDLRPPSEIEEWGGPAPDWASENWVNVALKNPAWLPEDYSPELGHIDYMVSRYRELLGMSGEEIVAAIRVIANPAAPPVVVHCLGGRDRTGVIIAFIMDMLGVSDEEIYEGYQLTEVAHQRRKDWERINEPSKAAIDEPDYHTKTPSEVLRQVLTGVREQYGSVQGYLEHHGFTAADLNDLRRTYLK